MFLEDHSALMKDLALVLVKILTLHFENCVNFYTGIRSLGALAACLLSSPVIEDQRLMIVMYLINHT